MVSFDKLVISWKMNLFKRRNLQMYKLLFFLVS